MLVWCGCPPPGASLGASHWPSESALGQSWGGGWAGQTDLPSFSCLSFPSTQGGPLRTFADAFLGVFEGGVGAGQGSGQVTAALPWKAPGLLTVPRSGQQKVQDDSQRAGGSWSPHSTEECEVLSERQALAAGCVTSPKST